MSGVSGQETSDWFSVTVMPACPCAGVARPSRPIVATTANAQMLHFLTAISFAF
jgi:hypothetical protein